MVDVFEADECDGNTRGGELKSEIDGGIDMARVRDRDEDGMELLSKGRR